MGSLHPDMMIGNGRFQLIERIGEGGMGEVWFAQDLVEAQSSKSRHVAIKAIQIDGSGSSMAAGSRQELLKRFEREATFLRKLNHPQLAGFIDFGKLPSGIPFMAMEYVEGASLDAEIYAAARDCGILETRVVEGKERLVHRDPRDVEGYISEYPVMSLRDIFAISQYLIGCLSYLHNPSGMQGGEGITHRDVKPANIKIQRDLGGKFKNLKLLDLGIAKAAAAVLAEFDAQTQITMCGDIVGTRTFMPREQFTDPEEVGPPADVYAAGITMFEMITGLEPYARCNNPYNQMLVMKDNTKPFDPGLYIRNVPPHIRNLIIKATQPKSEDRYQNAFEMLRDFQQALFGALDYVQGRDPANATLCSQPTVASDRPPPSSVRSARASRPVAGNKKSNGAIYIVGGAAIILGLVGTMVATSKMKWLPERELPAPVTATQTPRSVSDTRTVQVPKSRASVPRPRKAANPPAPVLAPAPAVAPPALAPVSDSREMDSAARAIYDQGMLLYKHGRYRMALEKFEAARDLASNNPDIRGMIADCRRRLGR